VESLKYEIRSSISLYKFNNTYDYFFGEMPIDASYIKYFDISYIDTKSVVLLLPNTHIEGNIKPYEHFDKVFNAFSEFSKWCKCQNIQNVYDLNTIIASGKINNLIYMQESYLNKRLYEVASNIVSNENIKMILIGGPSSSGKTTTAKKLNAYLRSMGLIPHTISIDDYFLEREETPRDEDGRYDFESLQSIDLKLFNNNLKRLVNKEEVLMPTFNFVTGKKEYKNKLKLENNGILIIEGLHALNDELITSIDNSNKFKIYISPLTSLNIDNHNRITTSDLRLIRRMVRDSMNRGYDATSTLDNWKRVRSGEEKHVFPYQNKCDVVLNSSLVYELGVLRVYAEPLLFSVSEENPNYNEARRLINLIRNILPIPSTNIPYDSVLREFIGDSYFNKIGEE
jgi:uridine kinase